MLKKVMITSSICVLSMATAHPDKVIDDNLKVEGNTCIGFDCVNGENFTDELKLKENNTRIAFYDSNDTTGNGWKVSANNSSNGGESYIQIGQVTHEILVSDGTISGYDSEGNYFPSTDPLPTGTQVYRRSNDDGQYYPVYIESAGLKIDAGSAGGVAIGQGASTTDSTVSIGSSGSERRLANVATGIADTDAVNMAQFNAFVADTDAMVSTYDYNAELSGIQARQDKIDYRLDSLAKEIDAVTATAAALSAVQANPRSTGNTQLGLGVGNYRGEGAIAVGVYRFSHSDQVMYNAGVATHTNGGGIAGRAGVSFGW